MADEGTINWVGKSGTRYKYWIYKIDTTFTKSPANYVFAKQTSDDKFSNIYTGETGDISERFDSHHKMPCIKREGATRITAHGSSGNEKTRKREEADIVDNYNPACNG